MPSKSPPAVSALTPPAVAALLGCAAVLATADRSREALDGYGSWPTLWLLAGVAAGLAALRATLPVVGSRVAGTLWLPATAAGAALLARHGLGAATQAVPDFAESAPLMPGLNQGEGALLALLAALTLPMGLFHRLRSPRPAVLLPALIALVLVAVPLVVGGLGSRPVTWTGAPGGLALSNGLALAWLPALVSPAAMAFPPGRAASRWVGLALVSGAAVAGLGYGLAATGALRGDGAPALLSYDAARLGYWGREIGAGLEAGVALVVASVVILLGVRIAARSFPRMRSGAIPLLALAAALLVAWVPYRLLCLFALGCGWLAVAVGSERDPTDRAEQQVS